VSRALGRLADEIVLQTPQAAIEAIAVQEIALSDHAARLR